MKQIFIGASLLLSVSSVHAATCAVMDYETQTPITVKTINENSTLLTENSIQYKVRFIADNRYVLVMTVPDGTSVAAMGLQGTELTLANTKLNRTVACKD